MTEINKNSFKRGALACAAVVACGYLAKKLAKAKTAQEEAVEEEISETVDASATVERDENN